MISKKNTKIFYSRKKLVAIIDSSDLKLRHHRTNYISFKITDNNSLNVRTITIHIPVGNRKCIIFKHVSIFLIRCIYSVIANKITT